MGICSRYGVGCGHCGGGIAEDLPVEAQAVRAKAAVTAAILLHDIFDPLFLGLQPLLRILLLTQQAALLLADQLL